VASRYYKGPELLVDDRLYHYSLDMWSTGCTMAGMIFRIETFFKGSDNFDQLFKIVKALGSESLVKYLDKYGLGLPNEVKNLMKNREFPKIPWSNFVNDRNRAYANDEAMDLLEQMLKFDKNERITPKQAMQHPYFLPVAEMCREQEAQGIL
jgi:casein kinase II subunit alpha